MRKFLNWFVSLFYKIYPPIPEYGLDYPQIIWNDVLDTYLISINIPGDLERISSGEILRFIINRKTLLSKLQSGIQADHDLIQSTLHTLGNKLDLEFEIEQIVIGFSSFEYYLKVSKKPEDDEYLKIKDDPKPPEEKERQLPIKVMAKAAGT